MSGMGNKCLEWRILVAVNHDVFQLFCCTFLNTFSMKGYKLVHSSCDQSTWFYVLPSSNFTKSWSMHIFVWFRWSVAHSNLGMICYICQGENNMAWPIFGTLQERHIIYNIYSYINKRGTLKLEVVESINQITIKIPSISNFVDFNFFKKNSKNISIS